MKFFFRVDASVRMGTGHIMRCLTLAEALRSRGVQSHFICREHTGNPIALLRQRAFPVTVLPAPAPAPAPAPGDSASREDYAAWLGVTQDEDAGQTIEAFSGQKADWLVVDHYGLDVEWERQLRPHVAGLMVIDDLANRHHACDVLLDQNYSIEGDRRYAGLVTNARDLLVGPYFALLRPEYAVYRQTLRTRDGRVGRVLIFLGGSDSQNVTGMALEALSHPDLVHLEVDVVAGANNPHRNALVKQAEKREKTTIHDFLPHLAALMARADLAIGAGGATTWERMCLGLPTIVVSIAENQQPASAALAGVGLVHYAGHFPDVTTDQLAQQIRQLIHLPGRLADMSMVNQLQVDGLGALRVAEVLHPSNVDELRLRSARDGDIVSFYNWVSDPSVRKNTANTHSISWAMHQAWFAGKLHNDSCHLFVLEAAAGLPVGQIRFDRCADEARIDCSLDRIVRKRGWGSRLVAMGAGLAQQITPVWLRAEVKAGNGVSCAAFLRAGFTEDSGASEGGGTSRSIAILSDRASWMNDYIPALLWDWIAAGHRVLWVHDKEDLLPGDFCFYLSCWQIVPPCILSQYRHNLVVHESDLPRGKGWSPLTWQILEGKSHIPVSLLEATEKVDGGAIYAQEWLVFDGHELIGELREAQAEATVKLCRQFVDNYPQILINAREQVGEESFYPRRLPSDSCISPEASISDLFALLRVADPDRYPCFFNKFGHRYKIRLEKYTK